MEKRRRRFSCKVTIFYEYLIFFFFFSMVILFIMLPEERAYSHRFVRPSFRPSVQSHFSTTLGPNWIKLHWRGRKTYKTSPTVVSLKGRLPKKLQSKSSLSCEIVQIHSLFRHGFIKKPKS